MLCETWCEYRRLRIVILWLFFFTSIKWSFYKKIQLSFIFCRFSHTLCTFSYLHFHNYQRYRARNIRVNKKEKKNKGQHIIWYEIEIIKMKFDLWSYKNELKEYFCKSKLFTKYFNHKIIFTSIHCELTKSIKDLTHAFFFLSFCCVYAAKNHRE